MAGRNGIYEKTALGTLTMSHSSGKWSRTSIHRIGEKKSQGYTQGQMLRVSSLDNKHIEPVIGSNGGNPIQGMGCRVPFLPYTGVHIGGRSMVLWDGKSALSKSAFL